MPPTNPPPPPPSPPLHFLIPLYPAFQLLDLAGPIDILNLLSSLPNAPPLTLTFISETLDPVPTKPIPPKSAAWTFDLSPYASTSTSSAGSKPDVNLDFNQYLVPDVTYDGYISALNTTNKIDSASSSSPSIKTNTQLNPIDVLLIPGGIGSRLTRIYANPHTKKIPNIAPLLTFIPLIAPHIRHSIITVCTGSHILAQTGLLDNRRATTNVNRFDLVAESNVQVKWQRGARWVRSLPSELSASDSEPRSDLLNDGHAAPSAAQPPRPPFTNPIYTSAGISAGMDVMLAFIADNYPGGMGLARQLAKMLEYDWREIGEGERDPLYDRELM